MAIDTNTMQTLHNRLMRDLPNDEGAKRIASLLTKGPEAVYPALVKACGTPTQFRAMQSRVDAFFNRLLQMAVSANDSGYTVWLFARWQQQKNALVETLTPDNFEEQLNNFTQNKYKEEHMGIIKSELLTAIRKAKAQAEELHRLQLVGGRAGNVDRYNEAIAKLNQLEAQILAGDIPDTKDAREYADGVLTAVNSIRLGFAELRYAIVIANIDKLLKPLPQFDTKKPWKGKASNAQPEPDLLDRAIDVEGILATNMATLSDNEETVVSSLVPPQKVEDDPMYIKYMHEATVASQNAQAATDEDTQNYYYEQAGMWLDQAEEISMQIQQSNQLLLDQTRAHLSTIVAFGRNLKTLMLLLKGPGDYITKYNILYQYGANDITKLLDDFAEAVRNDDENAMTKVASHVVKAIEALKQTKTYVPPTPTSGNKKPEAPRHTERPKQTLSPERIAQLKRAGLWKDPQPQAETPTEVATDPDTTPVSVDEQGAPSGFDFDNLKDNK